MRGWLPAALAGILFGAGLALSDMINPGRVLAFLDVAGAWDPTLAFVMAGALVPSAIAYRFARRMGHPLLGERFAIPGNRALDRRLLGGAALFGIGWGIAGFCPGPALAALILGMWEPLLFVAAMALGMALHHLLKPRTSAAR
jgi:uncharacterized protein